MSIQDFIKRVTNGKWDVSVDDVIHIEICGAKINFCDDRKTITIENKSASITIDPDEIESANAEDESIVVDISGLNVVFAESIF